AESPAVSWREQAVSRSLDSARARAEDRVQRFIDAALELMSESPSGKDFTVQDILATSGQSLRAFYQYFGGKQELLLAVFEESVAAGVVRGQLPRRRLAGVVLEVIMFNAFSTTISGTSAEGNGGDPAEELWDVVLHGIGGDSSN